MARLPGQTSTAGVRSHLKWKYGTRADVLAQAEPGNSFSANSAPSAVNRRNAMAIRIVSPS
jgi:hypothetical protein